MTEQEYADAVGARIRKLRQEKRPDLGAEKFAVYAGIARQTLVNAETGKTLMGLSNLKKVADFLDITVQELLPSAPKLEVIDSGEALKRAGKTGGSRLRKSGGSSAYAQTRSSQRVRAGVA